jgi:hypothetical protein
MDRRKRAMKRLILEELERRLMLSAPEIAMASTGLTNNSVEDFYRAQVGTESGGAAGVAMSDDGIVAPMSESVRQGQPAVADVQQGNAPSADSGVGQMLLTTGANTLGIGSFAVAIAGPSRSGGTGTLLSTAVAEHRAAHDLAIESLADEQPGEGEQNVSVARRPGAVAPQALPATTGPQAAAPTKVPAKPEAVKAETPDKPEPPAQRRDARGLLEPVR